MINIVVQNSFYCSIIIIEEFPRRVIYMIYFEMTFRPLVICLELLFYFFFFSIFNFVMESYTQEQRLQLVIVFFYYYYNKQFPGGIDFRAFLLFYVLAFRRIAENIASGQTSVADNCKLSIPKCTQQLELSRNTTCRF